MDLPKFFADLAAKAAGVSQPATVTSFETAAGLLVQAGLAVFNAVQAVRAEKAKPAAA